MRTSKKSESVLILFLDNVFVPISFPEPDKKALNIPDQQ